VRAPAVAPAAAPTTGAAPARTPAHAARPRAPEARRASLGLHAEPERAPGVGAGDLDHQVVAFDAIAAPGDVFELVGQPAADRVVLVGFQVGPEGLVEALDVGGGHHAPASVAVGEDGLFGFLVELILD